MYIVCKLGDCWDTHPVNLLLFIFIIYMFTIYTIFILICLLYRIYITLDIYVFNFSLIISYFYDLLDGVR